MPTGKIVEMTTTGSMSAIDNAMYFPAWRRKKKKVKNQKEQVKTSEDIIGSLISSPISEDSPEKENVSTEDDLTDTNVEQKSATAANKDTNPIPDDAKKLHIDDTGKLIPPKVEKDSVLRTLLGEHIKKYPKTSGLTSMMTPISESTPQIGEVRKVTTVTMDDLMDRQNTPYYNPNAAKQSMAAYRSIMSKR